MGINFHSQAEKFRLANARKVKAWLKSVLTEEGFRPGNISVIFCSDSFLREINRNFLEHDYFTDVITFDYTEEGRDLEAEIYISVDTVKINARERKLTFIEELRRVIVHGVLHLVGYDDKNEVQKNEMRKREDYFLKKFLRGEF